MFVLSLRQLQYQRHCVAHRHRSLNKLNKLEEEKVEWCHSLWCSFVTIPCPVPPYQDRFALIFSGSLGQRRKSHMPPLPCDQEYTSGALMEGSCPPHSLLLLYHSLHLVFSWNFWSPSLGKLWNYLSSWDKSSSLGLLKTVLQTFTVVGETWPKLGLKKMCQSYGSQKFGSAAAKVCSASKAGDVKVKPESQWNCLSL